MSKEKSAKTKASTSAETITASRFFVSRLINWHHTGNTRQMPWKGEKDPYKIWVSEIILQQTRVAQGMDYYLRIIKAYPTVEKLAAAPDAAVFKLWEGLGYYSRCRNLLATARIVARDYNGHFPDSYASLLDLPGIGPYTAAAIASFAFQLPHAVVDGNVFRVLARYFGEDLPTDSTAGKKYFTELANQLLYKRDPAGFNQAIMDFGATICKPQQPLCGSCFLKNKCAARQHGLVHYLPIREKIIRRSVRHFTYWVFEYKGKRAMRERTSGDIWQHLSEFYLVETAYPIEWNPDKIKEWLSEQGVRSFLVQSISPEYSQTLTHQQIKGVFIRIRLQSLPGFLHTYQWVSPKSEQSLALPKFIHQWLEDPLP